MRLPLEETLLEEKQVWRHAALHLGSRAGQLFHRRFHWGKEACPPAPFSTPRRALVRRRVDNLTDRRSCQHGFGGVSELTTDGRGRFGPLLIFQLYDTIILNDHIRSSPLSVLTGLAAWEFMWQNMVDIGFTKRHSSVPLKRAIRQSLDFYSPKGLILT